MPELLFCCLFRTRIYRKAKSVEFSFLLLRNRRDALCIIWRYSKRKTDSIRSFYMNYHTSNYVGTNSCRSGECGGTYVTIQGPMGPEGPEGPRGAHNGGYTPHLHITTRVPLRRRRGTDRPFRRVWCRMIPCTALRRRRTASRFAGRIRPQSSGRCARWRPLYRAAARAPRCGCSGAKTACATKSRAYNALKRAGENSGLTGRRFFR
mgnify:CR=1 FL=1